MTSPSPFFDDPALKVLDAAILKAWDVPPTFPSLLQDQENYVTQAQAVELAKFERATHTKAAKELIGLYKQKLQLFDKKISDVEMRDRLRCNLSADSKVDDLLEKLKSMRINIRRGELDFLQTSAPPVFVDAAPVIENAYVAPSSEPRQAHFETSAQPQTSAPKLITVPVQKPPIPPGTIPERPKFTSSAGLAYVAEKKAQESATKQRRDAFHSALRQKQHFTPIEEVPSQKVMDEVAHSGGSNLDGSYIETGVTYEDIVGARSSISPFHAKYAQPNFDETGLEDLDQCIIPEPTSDESKENTSSMAPPFTPVSRKFDLGPFMFESSRPSNILPSRPNLSCSVGKKWLNEKK